MLRQSSDHFVFLCPVGVRFSLVVGLIVTQLFSSGQSASFLHVHLVATWVCLHFVLLCSVGVRWPYALWVVSCWAAKMGLLLLFVSKSFLEIHLVPSYSYLAHARVELWSILVRLSYACGPHWRCYDS